ncbi:MAG TPA: porin family protein [Puia sp.]|nr:porin family protein [Puia sp.]
MIRQLKKIKAKAIICICLTGLLLLSQIATAQKTAVGLRYLLTYSSFDLKTADGAKLRGQSNEGYGIGILMAHCFSEYISMQDEIIYSSISQTYKDIGLSREINLKNIDIPILMSLNTGISAPVNVNIVAGPQIGINIGSHIFSTGLGNSTLLQPVLNVKSIDISLVYGGGFDYKLSRSGNMRLSVGFRGTYGLTDISNKNKSINDDSYNILGKAHVKTNSLYLGLLFLL